MSHFFPQVKAPQFDASENHQVKMAGLRSAMTADMMAAEHCMGKCSVQMSTPYLSEGDNECLR